MSLAIYINSKRVIYGFDFDSENSKSSLAELFQVIGL